MSHRVAKIICVTLMLTPLSAIAAPTVGDAVARALNDPTRPVGDRSADADRKPAETLRFAGVRAGMNVGEFYPGGGYFTRLISDVVGPSGHVYGLENHGWAMAVQMDRTMAAQRPAKNVTIDDAPFGAVRFPVLLDLVWITQNYHDLKVKRFGEVDTLAFDRAVYAALKPGGIFFILDHQSVPGFSAADTDTVHRIDRALVIKEVTAAGFKLVAQGDFLHHADDDHTKSIFDASVKGHTDQFALKFVKP